MLQFGLVGLKEWLRQIMRAETSKTTEEQFLACEETVMAHIIEFYVPAKFKRKHECLLKAHRGKVIECCARKQEVRIGLA